MAAAITILIILVWGFLITYFFKLKLYLEERLCIGGLIGFVSFGYLMLVITFFNGLNAISLSLGLFVLTLTTTLLFSKTGLQEIKNDFIDLTRRAKQRTWIFFWVWVAFFAGWMDILVGNLFTFEKGAFYIQPVHSYGDISWHLSLISSFAYGNNFLPVSPIFTGGKISYPFMIDFLTSIFVQPLGLPISQAIGLTGILAMTITVVLMAYFGLFLTKKKFAAGLILPLFLLNGGFGFLYFLDTVSASHQSIWFHITHLSLDYTALKNIGFWWINVVISMLLPQRGFLLGLPMFMTIFTIFYQLSEHFQKRLLILGIALIATLPIVHSHTLIALLPFLIYFTLKIIYTSIPPYINRKHLLSLSLIGLVGVLVCLFISRLFLEQSSKLSSILHYQLGWMAHDEDIVSFYIKNFGINLVVIPLSYFLGIKKYPQLFIFSLLALVWFILPSVFLFQPWDFDNTKLFIYWYFMSLPLVGLFLQQLFSQKIIGGVLAMVVIFLITFSGFLDVFRLTTSVWGNEVGTRYQTYSPQAIELGKFMRENSDPSKNILSIDKFDNPAVALAGRKTLLGFKGWLWTYGLDYSQRETDVRLMLAGLSEKEKFKQLNVGYVVLFPDQTDYIINTAYFDKNFQLIYNQNNYRVYKI